MALLGEPQFAVLSAAASGNNTLVAAQAAGVKIRVLGFALVPAGTVTTQFQSGAGGTNLTGAMSLGLGKPIWIEYAPLGLFESAAATLLNLSLGGAIQVSGWLIWCTSS
jgi:hypothetical protein